MHRPMSESRRFQRSLQRHSAYPNLPRVTSSHIWTLQPSPPPFPGPKFIASSPVCSKCATSRLEITALESQSGQQNSGGKPKATPGAGREAFPQHWERIFKCIVGSFWRSCSVAPVFRLPVQDNAVVQ